MKTTFYLCFSWSVLSTGLLLGATDTHGRKQATPEPKQTQTPGNASAPPGPGSQGPGSRGPRSQGPEPAPAPRGPRAVPSGEVWSDPAALPDVSVTCSASDLVVRVKPAFYGLGAAPEELRLGSGCRSNGVLAPSGDLLFTYPLTACDAVRRVRSVSPTRGARSPPQHAPRGTSNAMHSFLTVAPRLPALQIRAPLRAVAEARPPGQEAPDPRRHPVPLSEV